MKMKAYRMLHWQQPPQLLEVPVPEPGPGQVLLEMGGAGACHSDLHLLEYKPGQMYFNPPFTLGHENAGWIAKLGPGVQGFEEGDPVVVYASWGCGFCTFCRRGWESYCECKDPALRPGSGGLGSDGGMAEYLLVPSTRLLVRLHKLDPRDAAPLTDATATAYHAVKRSLSLLVPGTTAVIIGVGGLGQFAVQLLRVLSATTIIAVDTSADKLATARQLGADHCLLSSDDPAAKILDLTHGVRAEAVFDFVGADSTLALAAQTARVLGHVTLIGLARGTLPFAFANVPRGCSFATILGCSAAELAEVVALAEAGKIQLRTERFPLEKVAEAYARLKANQIQGRAVILPNG